MAYVTFSSAVAGQVATASFYNNNMNALTSQFNGNIDSTNLANLAVTTAKINTGAVTGVKIAMGSDAQGDVLFRGASNYQRLAAGTSGQILSTQGAGANPQWVDNNGGKWVYEQTGTVSAAASFTISSLTAGAKYKLIYNFTQNTADGEYTLRLNGDSGANYRWNQVAANSAGTVIAGSAADTAIHINRSADQVKTGKTIFGELLLQPLNSSNNSGLINCNNGYVDSASASASCKSDGSYAGAAAVSSLSILTSAGTMTGVWTLYKLS